MNFLLVLAAILVVAGLVVSYVTTLSVARREGAEEHFAAGHAQGWRDAHERVAAAMDLDPRALNLTLLDLELSASPRSPEIALGNALRAASAGNQPAANSAA